MLITDDDAAIRALLTTVCKRAGLDCDGAADGAVALEKIRSIVFDVMLLDLMMPKVDGYQVIATLRHLTHRPAVIVLTAQGLSQSGVVVDGSVVHALVQKPFDLEKLTEILIQTARAMFSTRTTPMSDSH